MVEKVTPIEDELAGLKPKKDMALTIGVFDGVHRGHKYLISKLLEQARENGLLIGVVTFSRHPLDVLSPKASPPCLTTLTERVRLLKGEGVDAVVVLSFTSELAGLSAREFVSLLKKHLRMRSLVIGPDFALGKKREGNTDTLRALGQEMGFSVTIVPPGRIEGGVVSSTAIREALTRGDVKRAAELTGRPFSLQGKVITGDGRGTGLGFPTVNLEVDPKMAIPADGVYATLTYIAGKAYRSMTNIGRRPTFNGSHRTIETYILDYKGNLYDQDIKIDFIERLRDEKKFATIDDLKKQITEDVKRGMAILDSCVRK